MFGLIARWQLWEGNKVCALSALPPSLGTMTGDSANTPGPPAPPAWYETLSSCPANVAYADIAESVLWTVTSASSGLWVLAQGREGAHRAAISRPISLENTSAAGLPRWSPWRPQRPYRGIPRFSALHFTVLHRCCLLQIEDKTLHPQKDYNLLYCSGLKPNTQYCWGMPVV